MKDAVDFMSAPDPQLLHDLGLDALVYTGSARPSQDWVDRARGLGVTVTFIQETVSTRSQQGFQAGVYDCEFAERRAKELGHTGSIAYVVSDGSWSDVWDASEYGRGVQSVATLPFFAYGAVPICESFNRGAPHSLGTWVPETWGAGTLLTQVVGASPVADTDLNHAHADYTGAPSAPTPAPVQEDDDMIYSTTDQSGHTQWYRLAQGYLIPIDDVTAFTLNLSGVPKAPIGGPLVAVKWNLDTKAGLASAVPQ